MNKTKEQIYEELKVNTAEWKKRGIEWFSAGEISNRFGISRTIVSQYLNEMIREKRLVKTENRPVAFLNREILEQMYPGRQIKEVIKKEDLKDGELGEKKNCFDKVIGADGSISYMVDQCKAAVVYPPNGLPVLLTGPTGCGKSYMVKVLYEYLKQEKLIPADAKLVTLNCSEYANNPELLTANLFGYKKGAFTGAYEDTTGLIQEADQGVLFLDEIHSLPDKCQEKLFVFLDKGEFYRFGDNTKVCHASVKMMFATSEDPSIVLLKTLLRRIPVIINLPSLEERSIEEKEQIILMTIRNEEERIHRKIRIGRQVFNALMSFRFEGNIGQLKDCIRLGCSNAYMKRQGEIVDIRLLDMPDYIVREAGKHFDDTRIEVEMLDIDKIRNTKEQKYVLHLYDEILEEYGVYYEEGREFRDCIEQLQEKIGTYYDYLVYQKQYVNTRIELLEEIVNDVLKRMETRYGLKRDMNKERLVVRFLCDYTQRFSTFRQWEQEKMEVIRKCTEAFRINCPIEHEIAVDITKQIGKRMEINLGEFNKILILLHVCAVQQKGDRNNIFGVILCHGYATATSMKDAVNKLLGSYVFEAIDMPLDIPTAEIGTRLGKLLERESTYRDAIFLVDMGSLEEIYQYVKEQYRGNIAIINGVTTRLALEVGSNILEKQELKTIAENASMHNISTYKVFENKEREDVLLFINESDIHAAKSMMELFQNSITQNLKLRFIPVDYYMLVLKKQAAQIFKDYNVVAVIGSPDPQIDGLPFIPIEEIIEGSAKSEINKILSKYITASELDKFNLAILKNFSLQNVIEKITILNVKIVLDDVERALESFQKIWKIVIPNKILIGLYVHICYLIERLVKKTPINTYADLGKFEEEQARFISVVKSCFSDVERRYSVEIPVSEIAYIWDYINLIEKI